MSRSELRALQRDFISFLRGGEAEPLSVRVCERPPLPRQTRLAIYQNAYRLRLREALATDHAQLACYLGDALWARASDAYIDQCPSQGPNLRDFGNALPAFLRDTAPYCEHPEIAELAEFERRLLNSFDARDTGRADASALQAVAPVRWPQLALRFHPSVQLFEVRSNCVELWRALKAGEPPPAARAAAQVWLIWRGLDRLTQFRSLGPDEAALLALFLRGGRFAAACEQLAEVTGQTDEAALAQRALALLLDWLREGLVQRIHTSERAAPELRLIPAHDTEAQRHP